MTGKFKLGEHSFQIENPEERVLPGLVLVGSVVYAIVATCFYYQ